MSPDHSPRYCESIYYVDGDIKMEVESLMRSGMGESEDEHDIKRWRVPSNSPSGRTLNL